jgi:hypothetical protein
MSFVLVQNRCVSVSDMLNLTMCILSILFKVIMNPSFFKTIFYLLCFAHVFYGFVNVYVV